MKGLIVVIWGILLFSINSSQASMQSLTIKEFVSLAEQNDPNLRKILKDQDKLNFILDQSLPSRKVLLEAESERGFGSDSGDGTSILTGTISKEVIETGTKVSLSHSKTTRPDREENITEFRVEQALYKNIFGRDVRLKKNALKEEEEIIRIQVLESYEEYINEILVEYLDYQKAYLDQELAEVVFKDAQKLSENVEKKHKKKIASQTDLDKSTLQVILRKEDVLLKGRELEQKRKRVEQIIGTSGAKKPSQNLFSKLFEHFKLNNSNDKKEEDFREVRIVELRNSIANKDLSLAKRESDPALSLVGGYDVDNSERFSSTINRNEAIVGLKLEVPLWDTQKSADAKSAAFNLSKSELELNITKIKIKTEMEQLLIKIEELQQRRELTSKKLRVSKRIVDDEKRRYNYGKLDLDDLLTIKSDYVRYQFQHQSEELEFGKALLQWLASSDQLLLVKERL